MSGTHVRYDFLKNNTCVQFIEYDPERTFMKTTVTIEDLKAKSTFVSERPTGGVYKYFNVWVGDKWGGLSTSISNGSIGFRIEKSWIYNNSVNDSLITLQLYNKSWETLNTTKVGEDNNYSYFTATVSSYSFFAITNMEGAGNKTEVKLQDTMSGGLESAEEALNGSENNSRAEEAKGAAKVMMAIALPIFLILVGYLVLKKKI
jgi:PGF-pre-PGF domain-containing protein